MIDQEGPSAAEYANKLAAHGGQIMCKPDATLRQNLDAQIVMAEKRVEELKATRERLTATGLLDARIEDLTTAMRW